MEFTDESKQAIQVALIALVISLGVTSVPEVFDNELKDYYLCDLTHEISEFKGGISGTAYSGYPFVDSRKSASKCGSTENKGHWIKLSDYAKDNGVDPYTLIEDSNTESIVKISEGNPSVLRCSMNKGCVKEYT